MQRHRVIVNGVKDDSQYNSRGNGDHQNQLKHDSQFNGSHRIFLLPWQFLPKISFPQPHSQTNTKQRTPQGRESPDQILEGAFKHSYPVSVQLQERGGQKNSLPPVRPGQRNPPAIRSALFKSRAFCFRLAPLPILPVLPVVKANSGHDLSFTAIKNNGFSVVDFFV
ncbi:hypothetical protein DVDV_4068 [Desulfovibrio sp. DV]|nr:hypothetical protein DVDV_4068 [Desulfovibrio sp. DV]